MERYFYGLLILIAWQNIRQTWLKWLPIGFPGIPGNSNWNKQGIPAVHYASDVLAGFFRGTCMAAFITLGASKIEKYNKRKQLSSGDQVELSTPPDF